MEKQGNIEAQVTTPGGTTIVIKGAKDDVAQVLGLFASQGPRSSSQAASHSAANVGGSTLDGVAEKDHEGKLHIVASDLKARSAMDAAQRLIYIALLARKELLGERKSERALINEVLKSYNLYDGNTRNIIPSDKALVTEGRKYVSLSAAALPKAWDYVREIRDRNVNGNWTPSSRRRRSKSKTSKAEG